MVMIMGLRRFAVERLRAERVPQSSHPIPRTWRGSTASSKHQLGRRVRVDYAAIRRAEKASRRLRQQR
jgi:hypothetical protein